MKGGTVQILWHGKDPILSVDFHQPTGLLATAGADRDIKFWALHRTEKSKRPSATFKASFSYHTAAVNVLRFSPSGDLLASGADNGELLIWKIIEADGEVPSWKVWKQLRFHSKDVLDLEWSPDGAFLVSGSVDNTSIIWNIQKGTPEQVLADHLHYVQGVTWDPSGKYVASLSNDRTCRIYSLRPPTKRGKAKDKNARSTYTCQHVLCKKEAIAGSGGATTSDVDEILQKQVPSSSKQYLFYDENMKSFFRRLSWSPDGSFLLIPSGVEKLSSEADTHSVSYIVSRNDLSRPALQLPAASTPVVAARFCPVLYKKSCKPDTKEPGVEAFKLPYKLVFSVATLNSVFIYDTEKSCPIAIFAGLHYAPITDLAWSLDAKFLAVSSQDGYCTLVGFDEGDLGIPLPREDLPSDVVNLLPHGRPATIQTDSSVASPLKDPSGLPVDIPLSEPMAVPEREPSPGVPQSPILISGKSPPSKKQSDGQGKPLQPRRISPKPISEYLVKSAVPLSDPNRTTGESGGVEAKEVSSLEVRGNESNAEVPSTASQGFEVQSRCRVGKDTRLDGVGSPVGVSSSGAPQQASTPASEAMDKETSELWELQKCSASSGRGAENQKIVELSSRDPKSVRTESGRGSTTTPLREDHALAQGGNPCSYEKPRDPNAHIYVRPLKFRRISPKAISDDIDKPTALKQVSRETSLPLPCALQELEPS